MSPATRWSASARCSWWAASSRRRATETIVPSALATTDATSPSRSASAFASWPTTCSTPHGPPTPGMTAASSGRSPDRIGEGRARSAAVRGRPAVPLLRRIVGEGGHGQGRPEHAERTGAVGKPRDRTARFAGDRARNDVIVAQLPDRHQMVVVRVTDQMGCRGDRSSSRSSASLARRVIASMSERSFTWRSARSISMDRCWPPSRRRSAADPIGCPGRRPAVPGVEGGPRRVRRSDLGRGQEALEVAEAVATVAARIDPVVAQATGVAPGTDRVRVHAQAGARPW